MKLVVFGLSLSSSWGNGHATTYRALLRAFAARGHEVRFYEWDAPWYRGPRRDLPQPSFCTLVIYSEWSSIRDQAIRYARNADAVIIGSYVKDGPALIEDLLGAGVQGLCFYDIDTPVTVAQLRRGEHVSVRPDQIPRLRYYFSFTGGPFLHDVLETELGARSARPLYCSVDADAYRPAAPRDAFGASIAYMGTYSEDRQPKLDSLLLSPARRLQDHTFLVVGPQYPNSIPGPSTSCASSTCRRPTTRPSIPDPPGSSTSRGLICASPAGRPPSGSSRPQPAVPRSSLTAGQASIASRSEERV